MTEPTYPRMTTVRAHKHTCANVQIGSTANDKCDCGALDTAWKAIEVPLYSASQLSALQGELREAKAERDGYLKIVGAIAALIPFPSVIKATGTTADLIAWIKEQITARETAERELASLRARLEEADALIARVPAALNNAFSAGGEEREFGSANRQERLMQPVHELREAIRARTALSISTKEKGEHDA